MSRFFDELESQLGNAARRRAAARRTRRRPVAPVTSMLRQRHLRGNRRYPLAIGGAVAIAVAAVAAVLALEPWGAGHGLDVVAKARAALAPSSGVVHMTFTTDSSIAHSRSQQAHCHPTKASPEKCNKTLGTRKKWSQWSSTDPYRSRTILRYGNGTISESDYADGTLRNYSWDSHGQPQGYLLVVKATRHYAGTRLPGFGSSRGNPAAALRRMLAKGRLEDEGTTEVGGRTVRRLAIDIAPEPTHDKTYVYPTRHVVYDVDPHTFAPVDGTITFKTNGESKDLAVDPNLVVRFTVSAYKHLPLTPKTAKLLRMDLKPGLQVVRRSIPEDCGDKRPGFCAMVVGGPDGSSNLFTFPGSA